MTQLTLVRQPAPLPVTRRTDVRRMMASDVNEVGALYAQCYPPEVVGSVADATADIAASLAGDYGVPVEDSCLVIEREGRIVGAILVVDSPPWPDVAHLVFIIDLFVHPDLRGQGVGRVLTEHAVATSAAREIGLRVKGDNTPAVALYRSLGFENCHLDPS